MTDTFIVVRTENCWTDQLGDDPHQLARRTMSGLLIAAQPVFKNFAGDLFWDYEWLQKHARPHDNPETPVVPIWWSWDESGTAIGRDRTLVAEWRKHLYKVDIPTPIKGRIDIIISKET